MASPLTRNLLVSATMLDGFLAGANVDRNLVQMPAWQHVGASGWAAYSRHADLSKNGTALYPTLGIGGTILSIAAALSMARDRSTPPSAALPAYAAAILATAGLLTTIKAAPFMLSLRKAGGNPTAVKRAFSGFHYWGAVRGVFQIAAFAANVWALLQRQNESADW